jgi:hypothetical protein
MNRSEILLREITEITKQYKVEVPSGRRAWPKAIRGRVAELRSIGIGPKKIAAASGLPYSTVFMWGRAAGRFHQMKTLSAPMSQALAVKSANLTAIVVSVKGVRIEGLSFEQTMELMEKLR